MATVAVLVLLAVPLVVALISVSRETWYPTGDMAQAELHVAGFFSHPPLVGAAGRIGDAFAPYGQGSHPGPAMWFALLPAYLVTGRSSFGLELGMTLMQLAFIVLTVVMVRRLIGGAGRAADGRRCHGARPRDGPRRVHRAVESVGWGVRVLRVHRLVLGHHVRTPPVAPRRRVLRLLRRAVPHRVRAARRVGPRGDGGLSRRPVATRSARRRRRRHDRRLGDCDVVVDGGRRHGADVATRR